MLLCRRMELRQLNLINLFSGKVLESNNIKLELKTVKFKLDLKKISLFIETKRPKLTYRDVLCSDTKCKAIY